MQDWGNSFADAMQLPTLRQLRQFLHLSLALLFVFRHIVQHEGVQGLFKGLGPNLVGVAPSRAIYFWSYANSKRKLNEILPPETPLVHILSATCAGKTN